MPTWLSIFFQFYWIFLVVFLGIGGYFMFRKFLKALPQADGKSILDWQEHYINQTIHLWKDEDKKLLNELVEPVPKLFRDVAKQKIAAKIGEIALEHKATQMKQEYIIQGYILATPKRDHKWLIQTLEKKKIDLSPYQHLF
ncbi:DUF2621 family protein [Thermoflavimicrobium daqui]|uniref:DUF2621 domain-containing protein n=1 Tax=Thermoflavimicrobium daqui TaxID=2137476 RepID=A0A364KA05_9BACL|nr:DUF2621 family protein [Thermoflavimicrobium daqui]RAL27136.1 DUF2621 domain-containing protein [Thermoflavimicrobium daqui]